MAMGSAGFLEMDGAGSSCRRLTECAHEHVWEADLVPVREALDFVEPAAKQNGVEEPASLGAEIHRDQSSVHHDVGASLLRAGRGEQARLCPARGRHENEGRRTLPSPLPSRRGVPGTSSWTANPSGWAACATCEKS
eukprot:scaffold312_cov256-Pinguiococcus_pyrenoidosus.AAC.6